MKSRFHIILFLLTTILLFLPMLQQHFRIFPFRALSGVEYENPKPKLSLDNWRKEVFQRQSEAYLRQHYGFREPLTRYYNQILYDFYHQSNLKNQWVYITDSSWYFESQNVREYYEGNAPLYSKDSLDMVNKLNLEALRIYQLQNILQDYGTHLFVLLIPGKEMIYPEQLPTDVPFPKKEHLSAYNFYKEKFQDLDINYIDIGDLFLQTKDTIDYPLFTKNGTHWSNLAAMHVADSLIRYMEALGEVTINHFSIGPKYPKTVFPDDDLEQLFNLIRPLEKTPSYYAETQVIDNPAATKPTLITIGDSFYWNIIEHTPYKQIFKATPYWYYFSSVYFDDPAKNTREVDVLDEVLNADFVMLSYSSVQLYKMSDGFSKRLLTELCYNPEEVETAKDKIIQNIKSQPNWLQSLQQRVDDYGIDLDTALYQEAGNVITMVPERYLPALNDSIPTKRSTKAQQYFNHE